MDNDEPQMREPHDLRPEDPPYEVGYGRPPIATRFKKGQSGNPKGRPRTRKAFAAMLSDALHARVRVREGDQVRARPKIEAAIDVVINHALRGDMRALIKLIDLAHKHGGFESPESEIIHIRETIVDPKADGVATPS